jgi:hypothetical protein
MNFHTVKVWLSKLISNLVLMLFVILVPAVASGAVPFWAAVVVAVVALLGLNAACGVLLQGQPTAQQAEPAPAPLPQQPTLRIVRGGRAA